MTLPHSLNIFDYPPMFQFDQPGVSNALARTACTDTAIQMIIQYYKERTYTLNNIRSASGAGVDGIHGLTIGESLKALSQFGVTHYRYKNNVDATDILQAAYVGPVLAGVAYYKYPSAHTLPCDRNNLAISGGRTDCGFGGAHAILAIGNQAVKDAKGKIIRYDAFTRDPDHHSTGPHYDRMTGAQFHVAVAALVGTENWGSTFMVYPTQKKKL